ncbi:replication initiator protein A [Levilactobacillus brevis]
MDQTNFKFYQADNVYGALFFQFPKVLMYGEQYRYLSSEAKLAYMVLKDRLEYSLRKRALKAKEGSLEYAIARDQLIKRHVLPDDEIVESDDDYWGQFK